MYRVSKCGNRPCRDLLLFGALRPGVCATIVVWRLVVAKYRAPSALRLWERQSGLRAASKGQPARCSAAGSVHEHGSRPTRAHRGCRPALLAAAAAAASSSLVRSHTPALLCCCCAPGSGAGDGPAVLPMSSMPSAFLLPPRSCRWLCDASGSPARWRAAEACARRTWRA